MLNIRPKCLPGEIGRHSPLIISIFMNMIKYLFPQGKLGHGDTNRVYKPKVIEGLQGLVIKKVCCGSQFSLALTSTGLVSGIFWMTCTIFIEIIKCIFLFTRRTLILLTVLILYLHLHLQYIYYLDYLHHIHYLQYIYDNIMLLIKLQLVYLQCSFFNYR